MTPAEKRAPRKFKDEPAKVERVPLLVGLFSCSGGGKTYSALRLATGMQRVTGGEIFGLDTEHRRMLHYANKFKFQHVDFRPPFSPADYGDAIRHCVERGASIVIVDSMTHEHEGPGGILEWHDELMDGSPKKFASAWIKPKQARVRLINNILQLGCNAIFCFRAKEKTRYEAGKDPVGLGWMPIGGEEYYFEMTCNMLLYPKSGGVPTWETKEIGERFAMKLPEAFEGILAKPQPLSEKIGEEMATWAAGKMEFMPDEAALAVIDTMESAKTWPELQQLIAENRVKNWSSEQRANIGEVSNRRRKFFADAQTGQRNEPPPPGEPERDRETGDIIPDDVGR